MNCETLNSTEVVMTKAEEELAFSRILTVLSDVEDDYEPSFDQWRALLTEVRDHCDSLVEAAYDQEALITRDAPASTASSSEPTK